jgi:hypothetical protein
MQAYEFYATPENGTITIPERYKSRITTGVKVIILDEKSYKPDKVNVRHKSDLLLPPSIDTKGWKFSREEANER